MLERMPAATFAAWLHLLGMSAAEAADTFSVNPRTIRAWSTGRDPIPRRVPHEVLMLRMQHDGLMLSMATEEGPIRIPRRGSTLANPSEPPGWWLGAAARLLNGSPERLIYWDDETPRGGAEGE